MCDVSFNVYAGQTFLHGCYSAAVTADEVKVRCKVCTGLAPVVYEGKGDVSAKFTLDE